MENLVISEFKLGIIAGGQLGKMLVLAASNWDIKTYILDKDENCPASTSCTHFIQGDHRNYNDVLRFGRMVDLITFEIENVNIEALRQLKKEGKKIYPDVETLAMIQDKGNQKQFYLKHNLPTSDFTLLENRNEILGALSKGEISYPFVQKLRKGGYDGRGVAIIRDEKDLRQLMEGPSVIEKMVDIHKEISIIVARNKAGETKCFPAVEMEFDNDANLVEKIICPASVDDSIHEKAVDLASKLASDLNFSGILAVEMFVDTKDDVLINEIAPRPHNSGHHTIESIITSQFEQLLRAIFNFPLGSTQIKLPAVMINLLGEPGFSGEVRYEGLTECMAIPGVKVHLYGKKITRPYRKMGHITILDDSIEEAKKKADIVKQKIKITSWQNLKSA